MEKSDFRGMRNAAWGASNLCAMIGVMAGWAGPVRAEENAISGGLYEKVGMEMVEEGAGAGEQGDIIKANELGERVKVSLGVELINTPQGRVDAYAAKSAAVYEGSMPGTANFVEINHMIPYLSLMVEARVSPRVSVISSVGAQSSYVAGDMKDERVVDAETEQFDFGPTRQRWSQFLEVWGMASAGVRVYDKNARRQVRFFGQVEGMVSYMSARSKLQIDVEADSYGDVSWDDLAQFDSYQQITTTARTKSVMYGGRVEVGVQLPWASRAYGELLLGMGYLGGEARISKRTWNSGVGPVQKEEDTVDSSGLFPTAGMRLVF